MAEQRTNGRPPELVYLPESSWFPPLLAAGVAAIIASIFTWWPYGVIGAVVVLVALAGWARQASRSYEVLPREQRLTLGRIPPSTLRRAR